MSTPDRAALQRLIEQWRSLASECDLFEAHDNGEAYAYNWCADALESALSAEPATETEAWKVPFRRMMDIVCMCGDTFPSIEQFIEHSHMVHDDKPEADIPQPSSVPQETPQTPPTWQPIATAPKDRDVLVFASGHLEDLPGLIGVARWHPDAGFTIDELRIETHWMPLPDPPLTGSSS